MSGQSGYSGNDTVLVQQENLFYWVLMKQQILLALYQLQNRQYGLSRLVPDVDQDRVMLVSPYAFESALISLVPGQDKWTRYALVRRLLSHECRTSSRIALNQGVNAFVRVRAFLLKNIKNSNCLDMSVHRYEHPARGRQLPIDRIKKLQKKYGVAARQIDFELSDGRWNIDSVNQINQDLGTSDLVYSAGEQNRVTTVLTSRLTFKTVWPKPIDEQRAGAFHANANGGEAIRAEFLVWKGRSFPYYQSAKTGLKALKMYFEPIGPGFLALPHSLQLILVLPAPHQTIADVLNVQTIGKLITIFWRPHSVFLCKLEQVRIPKFRAESVTGLFEPLEAFGLAEALQLKHNPNEPVADRGVQLFQRVAFEITNQTEAKPKVKTGNTSSSSSSSSSNQLDFVLDRPFLFLLLNETGDGQNQLLMMGVCQEPSAENAGQL